MCGQRAEVMTALHAVPDQTESEDHADVDECAPGVVPALAIDGFPRPGEVQRHADTPGHRDDVDQHPPPAHGEVAALLEILWRPFTLEALLQHRAGDHQV